METLKTYSINIRTITIIVLLTIFALMFVYGIRKETNPIIISINCKLEINGKYYIIGTITSNKNKGKVDIYKIDKNQYNDILEGFEYNITSTGINNWRYMDKRIVQCEQIKYD